MSEMLRQPPEPARNAIYAANPDVVSATVGSEIILLHAGSGVYYSLNPVGAVVWRAITLSRPVSDIESEVVSEFAVGSNVAQADVAGFIADLVRLGLASQVR